MLAKLFDVPGGQRLVRKAVAERVEGEEAPAIECVLLTEDAYFTTTVFFDTKADRDKVFDAVTADSFDGLALFDLPSFFDVNGRLYARHFLRAEQED